MKTERKVESYTCDNPACARRVLHDPEIQAILPDGYHGTVLHYLDDEPLVGRDEPVEWFACRARCIRPAVEAASEPDADGVDEETQASIRRGVAQAEVGETVRMDALTTEES